MAQCVLILLFPILLFLSLLADATGNNLLPTRVTVASSTIELSPPVSRSREREMMIFEAPPTRVAEASSSIEFVPAYGAKALRSTEKMPLLRLWRENENEMITEVSTPLKKVRVSTETHNRSSASPGLREGETSSAFLIKERVNYTSPLGERIRKCGTIFLEEERGEARKGLRFDSPGRLIEGRSYFISCRRKNATRNNLLPLKTPVLRLPNESESENGRMMKWSPQWVSAPRNSPVSTISTSVALPPRGSKRERESIEGIEGLRFSRRWGFHHQHEGDKLKLKPKGDCLRPQFPRSFSVPLSGDAHLHGKYGDGFAASSSFDPRETASKPIGKGFPGRKYGHGHAHTKWQWTFPNQKEDKEGTAAPWTDWLLSLFQHH